ncbi:MAG: hypothetical protein MJE68_20655 [Proteobacteria bacterium]|nr:hypothetical protein [Pseudomonadota bacterium]
MRLQLPHQHECIQSLYVTQGYTSGGTRGARAPTPPPPTVTAVFLRHWDIMY